MLDSCIIWNEGREAVCNKQAIQQDYGFSQAKEDAMGGRIGAEGASGRSTGRGGEVGESRSSCGMLGIAKLSRMGEPKDATLLTVESAEEGS